MRLLSSTSPRLGPSRVGGVGVVENKQACVFCQIVAGVEPAHEVWRDDHVVAFLDRVPLFHGHVLVVPLGHVETLPELAADQLAPLFQSAQRISEAMMGALGAEGSFVAMNNTVSQSVPHLHVHVVPRTKGDGLKGFFWPRHKYGNEEQMESVAAKIRTWLDKPQTRSDSEGLV